MEIKQLQQDQGELFIQVNKIKLHKYMKNKNELNLNIDIGHGCKQPDECYLNEEKKTIRRLIPCGPSGICPGMSAVRPRPVNASSGAPLVVSKEE